MVTERKPAGASWESWIDRQIREAEERGEFDNLPGLGKPIPDIDAPYDELSWIKQKLRRENVSLLPPTLALRKDVEDALERIAGQPTEDAVRQIVAAINIKIVAVNSTAITGPPSNLMPLDPEDVVSRWREQHPSS